MREGRLENRANPADPTRRSWLLGTAAAALVTLWPRGARADRYGPKGGTRILVIGDSMIAGGLGLFLARALGREDGYDVTRSGKSSTGLARPDFYDWPTQAKAIVGERPFDATVVMFGGNDAQGLKMRTGWIRWQDEGWSQEYARRIVALCDVVAPQHQQIFWVGMPVMKPEQLGQRVRRINTIFRAEMAIRRNAEFIDLWSLLADEQGRYTDSLVIPPPDDEGEPQKVRVRAGDGIHMTVAGAHYVAAHVREVVHTRLSSAS